MMTSPITSSMGLSSSSSMAMFYTVVTWLMGQAAPWIELLAAVSIAGGVVYIIRNFVEDNYLPQKNDPEWDEEED